MKHFVATFHHAELPPVHWHIPAPSLLIAQAEAWALTKLLVGCTRVDVALA